MMGELPGIDLDPGSIFLHPRQRIADDIGMRVSREDGSAAVKLGKYANARGVRCRSVRLESGGRCLIDVVYRERAETLQTGRVRIGRRRRRFHARLCQLGIPDPS